MKENTVSDEWSDYHEFRKLTDPPPYGQGKDVSPHEAVSANVTDLDRRINAIQGFISVYGGDPEGEETEREREAWDATEWLDKRVRLLEAIREADSDLRRRVAALLGELPTEWDGGDLGYLVGDVASALKDAATAEGAFRERFGDEETQP